jgi:transposase
MGGPSRYGQELRRDAVALVHATSRPIAEIAHDLGISHETLQGWVEQDRIDRAERQPDELTTSEREELSRLRQEADELRSEVEIQREILRKAADYLMKEMGQDGQAS